MATQEIVPLQIDIDSSLPSSGRAVSTGEKMVELYPTTDFLVSGERRDLLSREGHLFSLVTADERWRASIGGVSYAIAEGEDRWSVATPRGVYTPSPSSFSVGKHKYKIYPTGSPEVWDLEYRLHLTRVVDRLTLGPNPGLIAMLAEPNGGCYHGMKREPSLFRIGPSIISNFKEEFGLVLHGSDGSEYALPSFNMATPIYDSVRADRSRLWQPIGMDKL